MANLNPWQKITRVLPGRPFGNGADGDYNSSTIPTMTYRSCSGSASSTTLTLTSAGFSNGDLILIHQTRGTGAGQWEINYIVSGGGTTSLTLLQPLQYTYTDSGASQAQAVKIPQYTNVTVPSGATWTLPAWNGDTGGILVLAARGTLTVSGTITGSGKGFVGGDQDIQNYGGNNLSRTGESNLGDKIHQQAGYGIAGGAGYATSSNGADYGGGGGGGYGTAGSNAGSGGGPGGGGGTAGSADLTSLFFGGGGGAGASYIVQGQMGGSGGGVVIFFAKSLSITGAISVNGNNGTVSVQGGTSNGGGGGAGGSVLIVSSIATLSSSVITATGGSGVGSPSGGNGGVGRIALHYSSTYSGSTNPTLYANQDTTLVESVGGSFLFNYL